MHIRINYFNVIVSQLCNSSLSSYRAWLTVVDVMKAPPCGHPGIESWQLDFRFSMFAPFFWCSFTIVTSLDNDDISWLTSSSFFVRTVKHAKCSENSGWCFTIITGHSVVAVAWWLSGRALDLYSEGYMFEAQLLLQLPCCCYSIIKDFFALKLFTFRVKQCLVIFVQS